MLLADARGFGVNRRSKAMRREGRENILDTANASFCFRFNSIRF